MATEAQIKANHKYLKRNPDKRRLYQYRSNAKTFIKKYATLKDLDDLQKLIEQQRKELTR